MEKEKLKVEKAKESPQEKDMVDSAADTERKRTQSRKRKAERKRKIR